MTDSGWLDAIEAMYADGAPTAPLDDFRRAYADDDNLWWVVGSGHHQNLFDAACDEIDRLAAAVRERDAALARVEALAESLVWKRPEKSPCGDAIPDCCGVEFHCDAMRPSSKVVGHRAIRAALAGEGEQ